MADNHCPRCERLERGIRAFLATLPVFLDATFNKGPLAASASRDQMEAASEEIQEALDSELWQYGEDAP